MKPGDTFLVNLGGGKHLHVVLSHPLDTGQFVAVMLSTYDEDCKNQTCLVRASDGHPFIKHLSYVAYNMATLLKESDLVKLKYKKMPSFSDSVLSRILQGADSNSSDLPNKFWVILDDQHLIPRNK